MRALILLVSLLMAGDVVARATKGTGGGKTTPSGPTMTINAVDSPSGDYGRVHYQDSNDQYFDADLQCVTVSGNSSWFMGVITAAYNLSVSVGEYVWGRAIDWGGRNTDEIRYVFTSDFNEAMTGCTDMQEPQGNTFYVVRGNIDVKSGG